MTSLLGSDMKLVKCRINHNCDYYTELYSKMGEVVEEKKSVLLGFKDSLPVIANKNSNKPLTKKFFKVQIDPNTGDKFINLNGKPFKIVPESELQNTSNNKVPKSTCSNSTNLNILTKIPLNKNIHNRLNKVESPMNLLKTSQLNKVKFISLKTLSCDSNKQSIDSNVINEITTDNGNEVFQHGNISFNKLKCPTQKLILKKPFNMKFYNEKSSKGCHKLQTSEQLKDVGIQTEETSFNKHFDPFEDFEGLLDLDVLSDSLFVNPQEVTPSEEPKDNSLHIKFYSELRRAKLPDPEGNM